MTVSGCSRAAPWSIAATVLAVCLGGAALPAQTPTLGDIARKEEERRKQVAAPAKVYTNKDLPKPAVTPPPAGAPAAAPADQKAAEAQKPEPKAEQKPDEDVKDEAWWRRRITAARDQLQRHELAAEAFQSRVNALTNDFAARDDPYQRAQISIDRQKALNEMERVKSEIARVKQVITDIEEEARVAAVPPGWLR